MDGPALVMIVEMIECHFPEALAAGHVPADRIGESSESSLLMEGFARGGKNQFLNMVWHAGEGQSGKNQARFP